VIDARIEGGTQILLVDPVNDFVVVDILNR